MYVSCFIMSGSNKLQKYIHIQLAPLLKAKSSAIKVKNMFPLPFIRAVVESQRDAPWAGVLRTQDDDAVRKTGVEDCKRIVAR